MKSIERMLRAALLRQRQLAARNLHHDRHKVFRPIQLEVVDLHRDGQIGPRIAQHQRVFQLPLLVRGVELAQHLAREVALPIVQLRLQLRAQRDLDLAGTSRSASYCVV